MKRGRSKAAWRVRISDLYCMWEYVIIGTDDTSIEEVAQAVRKHLKGTIYSSELLRKNNPSIRQVKKGRAKS